MPLASAVGTNLDPDAFTSSQNVVIYCEPDGNIERYAEAKGIATSYQVQIFNVTYDANGGNFSNGMTSIVAEAEAGEYTVSAVAPTLTGYRFAGWTLDGNAVSSISVNSDVTLTASWTPEAGNDFSQVPASVYIEPELDFILVSDDAIDPRIIIYSTVEGVTDPSCLQYTWEYAMNDGLDPIWAEVYDDGISQTQGTLSTPVMSVGDFFFRLTVNGVVSNYVSIHVENHDELHDYIVISSPQDRNMYYTPVTVYIEIMEGGEGRTYYNWYKSTDMENWEYIGEGETYSETLSEHGVWYYILEVDGGLRSDPVIVTIN